MRWRSAPPLAALSACERDADRRRRRRPRATCRSRRAGTRARDTNRRDLNPDPNVLEIELEARLAEVEFLPGKKTPAWTYNGTVPGPLMRASVGDRLIVHFKNSLPDATTIHWHGLRVPNEMDGAPGVTQPADRDRRDFRYEFALKRRGHVLVSPAHGLVGTGRPRSLRRDRRRGPERPEGVRRRPRAARVRREPHETGEFVPADSGGNFGDLFGREGSVVLVNGKAHPTLKVRSGKQQRWRIINASRARYFSLRLRDHRFVRLGGDNGLAARSADVYSLKITPGERADAVFTPADAPGQHATCCAGADRARLRQEFARRASSCSSIETVADAPVTPDPIPTELRAIEPLDVAGATERTIDLTIAIALDGRDGHRRRARFGTPSRSSRRSATRESGESSTTPTSATRSTCTATSSRCSTTRACPSGRTPSMCRRNRSCGSRSRSTSVPACGCTTATSSTTRRSA